MAYSALLGYHRTMRLSVVLTALAPALAILWLALSPALAQNDRARDAVRSGQVRPLSQILGSVRGQVPGELLDAQLGTSGGRAVYQLRFLDAAGTVRRVTVDANTGQVISIQGGR